jgi:hypothetical protein
MINIRLFFAKWVRNWMELEKLQEVRLFVVIFLLFFEELILKILRRRLAKLVREQ